MRGGGRTLNINRIALLLPAVAIILVLSSFTFPWMSIDASERLSAPGRSVTLNLEGDFGVRSFDYNVSSETTSWDSDRKQNVTTTSVIADSEMVYTEGTMDLMDRIGILYHSAAERTFPLDGDDDLTVNVYNDFEQVPFWIVGQGMDITITAEAVNIPDGGRVEITRGYILMWKSMTKDNFNRYVFDDREFLWLEDWENDPKVLTQSESTLSITKNVKVDEDYGQVAIFGMFNGRVVVDGDSEDLTTPFDQDRPTPEGMNHIQLISTGEAANVVLALAVAPLLMVFMIITALATVLGLVGKKPKLVAALLVIAGVVFLLCVPMFTRGIETLIGIIDILDRDSLESHGNIMAMTQLGGVLSIVGGITFLATRPKDITKFTKEDSPDVSDNQPASFKVMEKTRKNGRSDRSSGDKNRDRSRGKTRGKNGGKARGKNGGKNGGYVEGKNDGNDQNDVPNPKDVTLDETIIDDILG